MFKITFIVISKKEKKKKALETLTSEKSLYGALFHCQKGIFNLIVVFFFFLYSNIENRKRKLQ
jgi:hypothetical protein